MRISYNKNESAWDELLSRKTVTLLCYCSNTTHCHRKILAEILVKLGAVYAGEATITTMTHRTASIENVVLTEVSSWEETDITGIRAAYETAFKRFGKLICIVVMKKGCGLPSEDLTKRLQANQSLIMPMRHSAHYISKDTGLKNTRVTMFAVSNFAMKGTEILFNESVREALKEAPVKPSKSIDALVYEFGKLGFEID